MMPRPRILILGLGLAGLLIGLLLVVALTPQGSRWNDDVSLYHAAAVALIDGRLDATTGVPLYPPFLSSYPPLSLVPMALPLLGSRELPIYTMLFGIEMCLVAGLGVFLVEGVSRRTGAVVSGVGPLGVYVVYALLCATVIPLRWDVVPSILILGALAAASGGSALLAGLLVGTGAAVKLYPAVLFPVLFAWHWYRSDRRGAFLATVGFAVAGLIGVISFLPFPGAGPLDLLRTQTGRGLELETLAGSVIAFLGAIGVVADAGVVYADGSFNLVGPGVDGALRLTSAVAAISLLLALAVLLVRFRRDRRDGPLGVDHLVYGTALMIVVLLLTNRVFSPQYIVWLLPVVPFLPWRTGWLALLAAGLTLLLFPFLYQPLLEGAPLVVGILLARNVALVAFLVLLVAGAASGAIRRLRSSPATISASANRTLGA